MRKCDGRWDWPAGKDKDTSRGGQCDRSGIIYRLKCMYFEDGLYASVMRVNGPLISVTFFCKKSTLCSTQAVCCIIEPQADNAKEKCVCCKSNIDSQNQKLKLETIKMARDLPNHPTLMIEGNLAI